MVIDHEVADRWGLLSAAARNSEIALPVIDGLLAATALEQNLTLVTRDSGQIPTMGVTVFNLSSQLSAQPRNPDNSEQ